MRLDSTQRGGGEVGERCRWCFERSSIAEVADLRRCEIRKWELGVAEPARNPTKQWQEDVGFRLSRATLFVSAGTHGGWRTNHTGRKRETATYDLLCLPGSGAPLFQFIQHFKLKTLNLEKTLPLVLQKLIDFQVQVLDFDFRLQVDLIIMFGANPIL